MKVFLDTNIFILFFVADDAEKHNACVQFFTAIQEGEIRPYTSNIVLFECIYVLLKVYKFPKNRVYEAIDRIIAMRNMTVVDSTDTSKALKIWRRYDIKYADCLIACQVGSGIVLCTYDEEFNKIPQVKRITPINAIQHTKR
jgi:predicted nucleic acid-binding protein